MGSFFAGIKAGTLGGVLYFGGLAAFNALLLYIFKANALSLISQTYPQSCPSVASVNSSSIEECFSSVVVLYLPYIAFLGFFASLIYSGLFGRFFERFPGRSPTGKGVTAAAFVGLTLLALGLIGVFLGYPASQLLAVFFFLWTGVYGAVLGRLYKRYTRVVRFESVDEASLRVLIDDRDYTGKSSTFAHTSTHRVRADVAGDSSFKGWTVSGGVTVEDPRSFETVMEVKGDGLLKAQGGKKY